MPENAPALDLSTLPDQPRGLTLDLSKLPDQPAPPKPPTLDLSVLPDLPPQLRPPGEAHNWGLPQATIGVPRESDDEIYKSLKDNATNDEQVLEDYYGKVVIDAMKRLYSPDTASPKALAAAQNAIAISQATGMSPTLVIENRDAVNQALFGTGEAREKFLMATIGMAVSGSALAGASELAAIPGLTSYARAADTAGEAWRLERVGEGAEAYLRPLTQSLYKWWTLPLGVAGFSAEENANALIRSYIDKTPFSQTQPYGLHDILPPQASEGTKAAVDLLDMFAKGGAMHAGWAGLQNLWQAMAYTKVSQILPSQKLYISPDDIMSHFGSGAEGRAGDYYDILQKLNLTNDQVRDAIKYGLDVEVPLARVVGSMDAPWFSKLKDLLHISPYKDVYEIPAGQPTGRLHVSGQLEAPEGAPGPGAEPSAAAPSPEGGAAAAVKTGKLSDEQLNVANQILTFFQSRGYSREQAMGAVSNAMRESSLNPTAEGDGGASFGLGQWNGLRRRALEAITASKGEAVPSVQTQLEFMDRELNGSEKAAGDIFRGTNSEQEAADALMVHYGRPQNPSGHTKLIGPAIAQLNGEPLHNVGTPQGGLSRQAFADAVNNNSGIPQEQKDAFMALTDARAKAWGETEGRSPDEWYGTFISGVTTGRSEEPLPKLFQEPEKLTAKNIPELYDYAISTPINQKVEIKYATIGSDEAARLREVTGFDLSGYQHSIDNLAIRHIDSQHGNPAIEEPRGQIAITRDDIAKIPEIVANPDKVTALKTHQKRDGVGYTKQVNGETFYVEEIRTGKKLLSAVSMRKLKAGATNAPPSLESKSATSETLPDQDVDNIASQIESGKPESLEQRKKGAAQFLEDGKTILHLFESADVSTLIHELGHILRRQLAPEDLAIAERWAKVEGGNWDREAEEKFARAFEGYIMEGVAPSFSLRSVFQKLKDWMLEIYKSIRNLKVRLNDDIRAVFDRLLSTEEERRANVLYHMTGEYEHGKENHTYEVSPLEQAKSPSDLGTFNPGSIDILHQPEGSYVQESEKAGRQSGKQGQIKAFAGANIPPGRSGTRSTNRTDVVKGRVRSGHRSSVGTLPPYPDRYLITIGKIFREIARRPVEILGLPIKCYVDFVLLAQQWRNPNYEELRYVYLKDNVIVDHEGITCRHPLSVDPFMVNRWAGVAHMQERIAALGADTVLMAHNHNVGDPTPSESDRILTNFLKERIPELREHIVINSGFYAIVTPSGEHLIYRLPNIPNDWTDPLFTPSVPHEILGTLLDTTRKLAGWAKALTAERNRPVIIYTSINNTVRGLQEISPGGTRSWKQLADIIPQKLVDFGSAHAVLVLPEGPRIHALKIGKSLVSRGVFIDVVGTDEYGPYSLREEIPISPPSPFKVLGGRPRSDFHPEYIR